MIKNIHQIEHDGIFSRLDVSSGPLLSEIKKAQISVRNTEISYSTIEITHHKLTEQLKFHFQLNNDEIAREFVHQSPPKIVHCGIEYTKFRS